MTITPVVVRSNRKTLAITVKPDGSVIVRAPKYTTNREIQRFVKQQEGWIIQHVMIAQEKLKAQGDVLYYTEEELAAFKKQAMQWMPERVAYYGRQMGVSYGRLSFRKMKSRWGSCSSSGNMSFNYLLMAAPEAVREYVIVHELSHRIEMNHSQRFWSVVEKYRPTYREERRWLKENGGEIIRRGNRD